MYYSLLLADPNFTESIEKALLTLNSCPMFTFNGRDAHRTLPALKIHLPFQRPIGEILPERQKTEDDEAEPALQRLPAPGLRGTWARAYALLTRLVSQIGWDELLKTRSAVFVMEEEYRMQKAQTEMHQALKSANGLSQHKESDVGTAVIHEDGTVVKGDDDDEDDDASTRALAPPTPKLNSNDVNGIPVIRVSTESVDADGDVSEVTTVEETVMRREDSTATNGDSKTSVNGLPEPNGVREHVLEKPSQAAANEGEQNAVMMLPVLPSLFRLVTRGCANDGLTIFSWSLYEVGACFIRLFFCLISVGPSCLDHLPC
jgi:hypothetical protein